MTKISQPPAIRFAKFAKATATTVYLMTFVKATVRPMFNLADKKSDEKSRKYSATNEFLYQVVCLGFAALMIPFAERLGFKLAEKRLKNIEGLSKGIKKLSDLPEFANIKKLGQFKKAYLEKSFDKDFLDKVKTDENTKLADEAMHLVYGGVETGSFLASIIGLTILAPKIGHEILHPVMSAMGMKDKNDSVGKPTDPFLADAKVPTEKSSKINTNA